MHGRGFDLTFQIYSQHELRRELDWSQLLKLFKLDQRTASDEKTELCVYLRNFHKNDTKKGRKISAEPFITTKSFIFVSGRL